MNRVFLYNENFVVYAYSIEYHKYVCLKLGIIHFEIATV